MNHAHDAEARMAAAHAESDEGQHHHNRPKVGWQAALLAFGAGVRVITHAPWTDRTDSTIMLTFVDPATYASHDVYLDPTTARAVIDALTPHAAPAGEQVPA